MERSTTNSGYQVLFLGELPFWHKISQTILEAPGSAFRIHRSASLRDALRRLESGSWHTLLVDLSHPSAQELLAAQKLHDGLGSLPIVALLPIESADFIAAATSAGASALLALDAVTPVSLREAILAAIRGKGPRKSSGKGKLMTFPLEESGSERFHATKVEVISHALSNLLCVINANADILSDQLDSQHHAVRSVAQIKKATKSAVDLMRLLTTS